MARYFFDVQDGTGLPDKVGVELADLYAARIAAAHLAGRLLCDKAEWFWNDERDWQVEVKDRHGLVLFTLVIAAFNSAALGG